MDKHIKTGVELKTLDDAGHGLARIATLSAIDHDGDTYAPGAFSGSQGGEQWAPILAAHNRNAIPLGKTRIFERGDEALAELHFNLQTQAGREWHAALKFDLEGCCDQSRPVQEWSYGYDVRDAEFQNREGQRVRVLKRLGVFEVSPVVKGAGIGTATLAMKHGKQPFAEQIDAAIALAADCLERARAVKDIRSEDGRTLSGERLKQLAALRDGLGGLVAEIEAESVQARRLFAGHVARQLGRR